MKTLVITLALAAVACAKPQLLGPETQLLLGAEAQLPALGLGQVQVRSQSPQAIYYHVQTYDNAIQPVAVQPAFVYQNQPQQYQYVPLAYNQYYYNQAAAIRTPLKGLAAIAGPLSVMGGVTIAAAAAIVIAIVFFNAHNNRLRSSDLGYARIYELNGYSNYNYGDLAATGNKVFPFRESWTKEYGSGAIQIP